MGQPNPPITKLITITIAITTYYKTEEFPKWINFSFSRHLSLNEIVVFGNCNSYD